MIALGAATARRGSGDADRSDTAAGKRRLPVINVTDRPDIDVRLAVHAGTTCVPMKGPPCVGRAALKRNNVTQRPCTTAEHETLSQGRVRGAGVEPADSGFKARHLYRHKLPARKLE